MSKSTPSLLALLGLVAVAGYQNRSKISDMMSDARENGHAPRAGDDVSGTEGGGIMADIGRMFQGGTSGGALSNGITDLVNRFKTSGRADTAESWVANGPNKPIDVDNLGSILGDETLDELSQKTGMTKSQLLLRLNAALPEVVNQFTPNGRVPTETEAGAY